MFRVYSALSVVICRGRGIPSVWKSGWVRFFAFFRCNRDCNRLHLQLNYVMTGPDLCQPLATGCLVSVRLWSQPVFLQPVATCWRLVATPCLPTYISKSAKSRQEPCRALQGLPCLHTTNYLGCTWIWLVNWPFNCISIARCYLYGDLL